jgi:hypothetical protein
MPTDLPTTYKLSAPYTATTTDTTQSYNGFLIIYNGCNHFAFGPISGLTPPAPALRFVMLHAYGGGTESWTSDKIDILNVNVSGGTVPLMMAQGSNPPSVYVDYCICLQYQDTSGNWNNFATVGATDQSGNPIPAGKLENSGTTWTLSCSGATGDGAPSVTVTITISAAVVMP